MMMYIAENTFCSTFTGGITTQAKEKQNKNDLVGRVSCIAIRIC